MDLELDHITYQGAALDDPDILTKLPVDLASILRAINGWTQFGGGLHVRGACRYPDWHALRVALEGSKAFHVLYPHVSQDWVPFAEDCVGDQFFLNETDVLRLSAETGDVEELGCSVVEFFKRANEDPVGFLSMEPLLQHQNDHGALADGFLLHAYPPFCTEEAARGVSLRPVPALELHSFHAELARSLPRDGQRLRVNIAD